MSARLQNRYVLPEPLYPLRNWLRARHVDVENLKSERQAFWFTKKLGNLKVKMPKHGQPVFPLLISAQRKLCPSSSKQKKTERKTDFERGTFGPASEVRRIDPRDYQQADQ